MLLSVGDYEDAVEEAKRTLLAELIEWMEENRIGTAPTPSGMMKVRQRICEVAALRLGIPASCVRPINLRREGASFVWDGFEVDCSALDINLDDLLT